MRLSIAILAGGKSRRFGSDKAAFRIGEHSLLEQVAAAARDTGLPVEVVGRTAPQGWPWPDVGFRPDEVPGLGPMGGLATALRSADGAVLAVGCDMPRLTTASLDWLTRQAREAELDHGLVTCGEEGVLQPLFAVYTPRCRKLVDGLLGKGMRSFRDLVSAGSFHRVPIPERYRDAVRGIDTPEEAEGLARELEPADRGRES